MQNTNRRWNHWPSLRRLLVVRSSQGDHSGPVQHRSRQKRELCSKKNRTQNSNNRRQISVGQTCPPIGPWGPVGPCCPGGPYEQIKGEMYHFHVGSIKSARVVSSTYHQPHVSTLTLLSRQARHSLRGDTQEYWLSLFRDRHSHHTTTMILRMTSSSHFKRWRLFSWAASVAGLSRLEAALNGTGSSSSQLLFHFWMSVLLLIVLSWVLCRGV